MVKTPRKAALEPGDGNRLSDLAYTRLLELFFDKRIPAGSIVSQSDLVKLSGVPVAPLRDALRSLASEGVVTIHSRTGIEFVRPGPELTRSTFQFRTIIERAAVAVFTATASDDEIIEMERQHREVLATVEEKGILPPVLERLESLEALLHGSIVATLKNPLIDSSYRRIRNYLLLIRLERRITPALIIRSLNEHLSIIEACKKRDAEAAGAALQGHFAAALRRSLEL